MIDRLYRVDHSGLGTDKDDSLAAVAFGKLVPPARIARTCLCRSGPSAWSPQTAPGRHPGQTLETNHVGRDRRDIWSSRPLAAPS